MATPILDYELARTIARVKRLWRVPGCRMALTAVLDVIEREKEAAGATKEGA
jgi:hypothetical protein